VGQVTFIAIVMMIIDVGVIAFMLMITALTSRRQLAECEALSVCLPAFLPAGLPAANPSQCFA
jgi:hypothetical protein